jgi:predicted enzyme related to lactoylglutathione lyase
MPLKARYAHTNIVAKDWRKLAAFYVDIFGSTFARQLNSDNIWAHK